MKTSFIYTILNSQPIVIKFALKLFVCKCLSFHTHLLLDLRFSLMASNSYKHSYLCKKVVLHILFKQIYSINTEYHVQQ